MTPYLNAAMIILGGLFVLAAAYSVIRGLRARAGMQVRSYNVARQESRQDMLVSYARGVFFLILALILFGVFGLSPRPEAEPPPSPDPGSPTATASPFPTATPTVPRPSLSVTAPTPTSPIAPPSATPTEPPLPTETPVASEAVVNSPNGLWLRAVPGGAQQLELIPDGTILVLLPGRETADDLEWQQVRTPAGNEGWVAVEFIVYR